MARNARAVVTHSHYVNHVAVTTNEVVKATAEVGGLAADVAMVTVGCH